jgi:hypothetical protein
LVVVPAVLMMFGSRRRKVVPDAAATVAAPGTGETKSVQPEVPVKKATRPIKSARRK